MKTLTSNDLDALEKKLKGLAENLYYLPKESVETLWNAAEESELLQMLREVNLEENDESLISTPPPIKENISFTPKREGRPKPTNHGKRWSFDEIEHLDAVLKQPEMKLDDIAIIFERTKRSIQLKGASLVDEKVNKGYTLERELLVYHGKIGLDMYESYLSQKDRDVKRKRRKK